MHGIGHDVRGGVTDDREPRGIGFADHFERRVGRDRRYEVDGAIPHPDRYHVFGELPLFGEPFAGDQLCFDHQWMAFGGFVGAGRIELPTPTVSR